MRTESDAAARSSQDGQRERRALFDAKATNQASRSAIISLAHPAIAPVPMSPKFVLS